MQIETKQLQIAYQKQVIVDGLSIQIPDEKITALVGANGSGKSTILKTMARLLTPSNGQVILKGKDITSYSTKDVAKQLAVLPQSPQSPEGLKVYELISYGRTPYHGGLRSFTKEDYEIIDWAITITGLQKDKNRSLQQLSGGQRQRAWIAMALAQKTGLLFLDEPTTYLDMAHQIEVLQLLKRLNIEQKVTIVMVVHDLNHAARFADHMIAIRSGQVIQQGHPKEIMNKEMLKDVFSIDADIIEDPRHHTPLCIPQELWK